MTNLSDIIAEGVLRADMAVTRRRLWTPLMRASHRPRVAQARLLDRILQTNAGTVFGRQHRFSAIRGLDDFRARVPVQTYETLRPLIDRQAASGEPCLTAAAPVMFARTSGTTGEPKDIPITAAGLKRFAAGQRVFAYALRKGTGMFAGRILGIGGPAVEGRRAGEIPYGSTTGMVYRAMPRLVRRKYVLPVEVFDIADYDERYQAIAVLGLRDRRVSGLVTSNPSTLLKLLDVINTDLGQLCDAIQDGKDPLGRPGSVAPDPDRARALARLARGGRSLSFADIWPDLRAVATWTGGSCGYALNALRTELPARAQVVELGYAASECRGSLTVDAATNACLPTLSDVVFEFVEQEDWEAGRHRFRLIDEIEEGRRYYVFVTTQDGLYRYDMNDIVTVTGRHNATPTIAFLRKGRGVTNLTGEKLSEDQLLTAVDAARRGTGSRIPFFLCLADVARSGYELLFEASGRAPADQSLADRIDAELRRLNVEYAAKRASGRLAPLTCRALKPGTGFAYRAACVADGQRDAQFKAGVLQYRTDCRFDFAPYRSRES